MSCTPRTAGPSPSHRLRRQGAAVRRRASTKGETSRCGLRHPRESGPWSAREESGDPDPGAFRRYLASSASFSAALPASWRPFRRRWVGRFRGPRVETEKGSRRPEVARDEASHLHCAVETTSGPAERQNLAPPRPQVQVVDERPSPPRACGSLTPTTHSRHSRHSPLPTPDTPRPSAPRRGLPPLGSSGVCARTEPIKAAAAWTRQKIGPVTVRAPLAL